jgi:transposase
VKLSPDREAEVLRLHHVEKWRIGTIAAQLGLHYATVQRVLAQAGVAAARTTVRPSLADPYIPLIVETLTKYPRLRASRLWAMARERGYPGGADHFRAIVARYRPRPAAEAFARLRTLPGEQAQVDWGYFGTVTVGRATRPLWGFVLVLSWSRQVCLRFYLSAAMPCFVRGHVEAFATLGGVPRTLLYDNLKSAVLERAGDAIRFHPTLLALATHYRFAPRPCRPYRANEKGRVERAIRYVRDNFFAARAWTDVADLNAQAAAWCHGAAADRRCPGDRTQTVRAAFAEERGRLVALPDDAFAADERVAVHVGKTPYVRFDRNDYSVPPALVGRTLTVAASPDVVRVLDGAAVVAQHARTWDRDRQVDDPAHLAALVAARRGATTHHGLDRLHHAVPASAALLREVAARGGHLTRTTWGLLRLLDTVGATALDAAVVEALARDAPHLGAVRQILDAAAGARVPPPPVELPDDPRVRDLVVRPHPLSAYDALRPETPDDHTS